MNPKRTFRFAVMLFYQRVGFSCCRGCWRKLAVELKPAYFQSLNVRVAHLKKEKKKCKRPSCFGGRWMPRCGQMRWQDDVKTLQVKTLMQESTGYLTIDAWTQFLWHLPDNPSITLSLSQHKAKIPLHWYLSPPVLLGSYFCLRLLSPAVLWQLSLRRAQTRTLWTATIQKTLFVNPFLLHTTEPERDGFYVLSFIMRGWMRGRAVASHWFCETEAGWQRCGGVSLNR